MQQFRLKRQKGGFYLTDWKSFSLSNNRDENILCELLSELFEGDMLRLSSIYYYQNKAKEDDHNPICGNATCVSFTDSGTVFIEPAREVDEKYQYYTEIPKPTFLYILDEWEKVLINKPDRVVITINDDKGMTFEQIFEEKQSSN